MIKIEHSNFKIINEELEIEKINKTQQVVELEEIIQDRDNEIKYFKNEIEEERILNAKSSKVNTNLEEYDKLVEELKQSNCFVLMKTDEKKTEALKSEAEEMKRKMKDFEDKFRYCLIFIIQVNE